MKTVVRKGLWVRVPTPSAALALHTRVPESRPPDVVLRGLLRADVGAPTKCTEALMYLS